MGHMETADFEVLKSSGEKVRFSLDKLRNSLKRSGADKKLVDSIINIVRDELYQGISTREIYNRAYALLKKEKSIFASKYKLKKAIYELGPTGFPFERFIAALLQYSGYSVQVGKIMNGKCVTHEVDVIARKHDEYIIAECKFHGDESNKCDVKVPLYIHSRYKDIVEHQKLDTPTAGYVVTNTRFTSDALDYGRCCGLYMLSWDYPKEHSLKDRIDRLGLYPITVSTLLTQREKQFLLSRDVVLFRQLYKDDFYLDHLGISDKRKARIMEEVQMLCNL
jgi:hypothetical protein